MILAAQTTLSKIQNADVYGQAATVNAAVVAKSGGKVPCYAINGKRVAFKWVSVGSSCVIGRGEAEKMLARVGVNIREVEAA
jgi:hypothetical protein